MDIAEIHVGSYATRIAQVAAAELAAVLQDVPDVAYDIWFDLGRNTPDDETLDDELAARGVIVEAMGDYVCARRIELGETLYRHAVDQRLVRDQGPFMDLPFEQRQPWETFVSTCRSVYGDLLVAQLAVVNARRQAQAELPAGLKREDSIFADDDDDLGTMIPEAVEALQLSGQYQRQNAAALQAERQRIHGLIDMRAKFNGADPAKFDHDGDGWPGGSKTPTEKAISRQARKAARAGSGAGQGQPLSVGEPPARPPVNRGGRGRKKTG